jgi:hypothetical protein
MAYRPARERLSATQRSEIARHAALERALQRIRVCECGHEERDHWSIGAKECRACEIAELPHPCGAFSPG